MKMEAKAGADGNECDVKALHTSFQAPERCPDPVTLAKQQQTVACGRSDAEERLFRSFAF